MTDKKPGETIALVRFKKQPNRVFEIRKAGTYRGKLVCGSDIKAEDCSFFDTDYCSAIGAASICMSGFYFKEVKNGI